MPRPSRPPSRRRVAPTVVALASFAALALAVGCTVPARRADGRAGDWWAAMLASLNAERANAGLGPLKSCAALERSAQAYAQTMAAQDWFDHTGPDGSTLASRAMAAGYGPAPGSAYTGYAENIAEGYPTVPGVMAAWMASPGHRENILAPATTDVGLGRAADTWWVQDFGVGGTC